MKNFFKVLLGIFVTLIYIPFSIVISYTVLSGLTNIFNANYASIFLNIIFGIIALIVLFLLSYLLEMIINKTKLIEKHIKFMTICCLIPIIIFCVSMVVLNFNFFNIQKEIGALNMEHFGENILLQTALKSISAIFFILAFIYLIVFIMYIIARKVSVHKLSKNKVNN